MRAAAWAFVILPALVLLGLLVGPLLILAEWAVFAPLMWGYGRLLRLVDWYTALTVYAGRRAAR